MRLRRRRVTRVCHRLAKATGTPLRSIDVSERGAQARVRAARERERKAREKAEAVASKGEEHTARIHRNSAQSHADAEEATKRLIEADRWVQGDELEE